MALGTSCVALETYFCSATQLGNIDVGHMGSSCLAERKISLHLSYPFEKASSYFYHSIEPILVSYIAFNCEEDYTPCLFPLFFFYFFFCARAKFDPENTLGKAVLD